MENSKLTGQNFWETYWAKKPSRKVSGKTNLLILEILKKFDQYLPAIEGLSVLEVGGASGEYLMYLTRRFRYQANSLDYSSIGNRQTLETFNRAGLGVHVYERDLFADNSDLPKFDIVYSLGFIEHFDDPLMVAAKHLELLKPGGILLLGVPNYSGIYEKFLKRMAPSIMTTHNLKVMDISHWKEFEVKLPVMPVFVNYIGGFEPLNMKKLEVQTAMNRIRYFFIQILMVIFSFHFQFLRKFNSKFWSGYLLGLYRKKETPDNPVSQVSGS